MKIEPVIAGFADELTAWRQDIHAHPELGFEEHRTSALVAERLRSFGCEVATGIGQTGKATIYMRARTDADRPPNPEQLHEGTTEDFFAISTRCMHLGCPVRYVDASKKFIFPCHGGVYDFDGCVSGGPPVRPLDRFYTRVSSGRVEVGERFSVNSELRRFKPRDPSNHLDGLWQYLYPSRPST